MPHNYTQKFRYIEKKPLESNVHVYKKLEIEQFIKQFFSNYGLLVHDLRLWGGSSKLEIFISYFSSPKTDSILVDELNKYHKYKLPNIIKRKRKAYITNCIRQKQKLDNYHDFNQLIKRSKPHSEEKKFVSLTQKSNFYNLCLLDNNTHVANLKSNYLLQKFFESLSLFTNRKLNICLTLRQLNDTIKPSMTRKNSQVLAKSLARMRKYQTQDFFKEGVHIIFVSIIHSNSATLLANFIASSLQKLKRHNLFLRFLKATLSSFYTKKISLVEGLKIKISGRFNGAPRARSRVIKVGNIPIIRIDSKIDYHEATSFTANGTFGVKVFICEKLNS